MSLAVEVNDGYVGACFCLLAVSVNDGDRELLRKIRFTDRFPSIYLPDENGHASLSNNYLVITPSGVQQKIVVV